MNKQTDQALLEKIDKRHAGAVKKYNDELMKDFVRYQEMLPAEHVTDQEEYVRDLYALNSAAKMQINATQLSSELSQKITTRYNALKQFYDYILKSLNISENSESEQGSDESEEEQEPAKKKNVTIKQNDLRKEFEDIEKSYDELLKIYHKAKIIIEQSIAKDKKDDKAIKDGKQSNSILQAEVDALMQQLQKMN